MGLAHVQYSTPFHNFNLVHQPPHPLNVRKTCFFTMIVGLSEEMICFDNSDHDDDDDDDDDNE